MMRSKYDEELEGLNKELILMGGLCENAIALCAKALTNRDVSIAGKVPEMALKIDEKEREIEGMCLKLLLRQQPVAKDLRIISSAMKMVTDMERIGDNSGDIAEIVSSAGFTNMDETFSIHDMALTVIRMVTDSIDAFVRQDVSLANEVIISDDRVDGYFSDIKTRLIERIKSGSADGKRMLDILMIAKYLERIGDHAVNIAGWVVFSVTGKM